MKRKRKLKICRKGHKFYKSSDCPTCPTCSREMRKKQTNDLPKELSAPALRALLEVKITTLEKLSECSEKQILSLHGVGPSSMPILRVALRKKKLSFKKV